MENQPQLLRLADKLEAIAQFVGKLGAWMIIPLVAIIIFDVVTRKFQFIQQAIASNPILYDYLSPTKLQEMEWHLHTVIFLLALGYAYTKNAHVRVDLVREKLAHRKQAWIEFLGLVGFGVPYILVVGYFSWTFITQAWESNEGSAAMTGLSHRWIIKSFVLIGLGLLMMAVISTIIRHLFYLFGPAQLREQIPMPMLATEESFEHMADVEPEGVTSLKTPPS